MQQLPHGLIAARPAEDEVDGRQETFGFQLLHRAIPSRHQIGTPVATLLRVAFDPLPRSAAPPVTAVVSDEPTIALGQLEQFRIDLARDGQDGRGGRLLAEQVIQSPSGHDVLEQRHRPTFAQHHAHIPANLGQPVAELLRVGHGRGQRHQLDGRGEPDDDLFPHRSAEAVGQVMDLIHHDVTEIAQRRRVGIDHVPEHLGGHDHDVGVRVEGRVTGQQPDPLSPEPLHEIVVLLVAQRLDRRGVEAASPLPQGQEHGELAHHRLARPGRRGDQDARTRFHHGAPVPLVGVQGEGEARSELRIRGAGFGDLWRGDLLRCRAHAPPPAPNVGSA